MTKVGFELAVNFNTDNTIINRVDYQTAHDHLTTFCGNRVATLHMDTLDLTVPLFTKYIPAGVVLTAGSLITVMSFIEFM